MSNKCKTCNGAGTRSNGFHQIQCDVCGGSGIGKLVIERKVTCGCCNGTKKYQPLLGPPVECDTCKGEGVVGMQDVEVNVIQKDGMAYADSETQPNCPFSDEQIAAMHGRSVDPSAGYRKEKDLAAYLAGEVSEAGIRELDSKIQAESRQHRGKVMFMEVDMAEAERKIAEKQALAESIDPNVKGLHPDVQCAYIDKRISYGMCILLSRITDQDDQLRNLPFAISASLLIEEIEKAGDGDVKRRDKNLKFAAAYGHQPSMAQLYGNPDVKFTIPGQDPKLQKFIKERFKAWQQNGGFQEFYNPKLGSEQKITVSPQMQKSFDRMDKEIEMAKTAGYVSVKRDVVPDLMGVATGEGFDLKKGMANLQKLNESKGFLTTLDMEVGVKDIDSGIKREEVDLRC